MATSRNNVRKRGTTWTYYAYVTDGTGKRRQISKGGFATAEKPKPPASRHWPRWRTGPGCVPSG